MPPRGRRRDARQVIEPRGAGAIAGGWCQGGAAGARGGAFCWSSGAGATAKGAAVNSPRRFLAKASRKQGRVPCNEILGLFAYGSDKLPVDGGLFIIGSDDRLQLTQRSVGLHGHDEYDFPPVRVYDLALNVQVTACSLRIPSHIPSTRAAGCPNGRGGESTKSLPLRRLPAPSTSAVIFVASQTVIRANPVRLTEFRYGNCPGRHGERLGQLVAGTQS